MGSGLSKNQGGHCGAPSGVDPRVFALVQVHKVPHKTKYLDMYDKYTVDMACKDIAYFRQHGMPYHQITKYHQILRTGALGMRRLGGSQDPREYVFRKIYKLRPREIQQIGDYYTKNMAVQEIRHQELRKDDPSLPKFRYAHSYGIRFENTKKEGHVYKQGRQGYATGFTFAGKTPALDFKAPEQINPKVSKHHHHHKPSAPGHAVAGNHNHTRRLAQIMIAHAALAAAHKHRHEDKPSAPPLPVRHHAVVGNHVLRHLKENKNEHARQLALAAHKRHHHHDDKPSAPPLPGHHHPAGMGKISIPTKKINDEAKRKNAAHRFAQAMLIQHAIKHHRQLQKSMTPTSPTFAKSTSPAAHPHIRQQKGVVPEKKVEKLKKN